MTTRKRNILLTILLLILSAIILATSVMFAEKNKTEAHAAPSDTATIGELYIGNGKTTVSSSEKVFNARNLHAIYTAIDSKATGLSSLSATTAGTSLTLKKITVTFGGIEWLATYLSKDTSGNVVLTLIEQTVTNSYYYTYVTRTDMCPYPANMYGTSAIRTYLNGSGIMSMDGVSTRDDIVDVEGDKNPYIRFNTVHETTTTDKVKNFLVTPNKISWQHDQSPSVTGYPSEPLFNNESLDLCHDDATGNENSYYYNNYYDEWKNDYVWLPSRTEIRLLWRLNSDQLDGGDSGYMTRTAPLDTYNKIYSVTDTGGNKSLEIQAGTTEPTKHGIRAGIHLNLTKADQYATYVYKPSGASNNAGVYNGIAQGITFDYFPSAAVSTSHTLHSTLDSNSFTAINAGTYTLTVSPVNTYLWSDGTAGPLTYSFTISKATYDKHEISVSNKIYDGDPCTVTKSDLPRGFTSTITYSGKLHDGSNYSSTTTEPTHAGTYTATVTFSGSNDNYELPESKSASFTISQATYDKHTISASGKTYDGTACSATKSVPELPQGFTSTITYSGTLANSSSYSSTTAAPKEAGSYTATLSFSGSNNDYKLPVSKTESFTISKANYNVDGLSLTRANDLTYNGTAKTATLSGSVTGSDGKALQATIYYQGTSSTSYNETTVAPTQAGDYKAYLKYTVSSNNYNTPTDNKEITFTIGKAEYDVSGLSITRATNLIYDGKAKTATINGSVTGIDKSSLQATIYYAGTGTTTYKESTDAPTEAGTYKAYFKYTVTSNNYNTPTSNKEIQFTISKANYDVDGLSITRASGDYDGNPKTATLNGSVTGLDGSPTVTVYYQGTGSTSYNETTTAPTHAGSYKAYLKYTDTSDNYNAPTDDKAVTFTIEKADYDVSGLSITAASDLIYNGSPKTATRNGTVQPVHAGDGLPNYTIYYEGINGTSYGKSVTAPNAAGEYKAYFGYSWSTENKDYNLPTDIKQITFTIAKADYDVSKIKITVPDPSHLVYNGSGIGVTVNIADLPHDADGQTRLTATVHYIDSSESDTTVAPVKVGTYRAYIVYATTSTNYNTPADTKSAAVTFVITPAQIKMTASADGSRSSDEVQKTITVTHFYDHSQDYDWKFKTDWFETVAADKASLEIQYSTTNSGFMSESDFHLSLNEPNSDNKTAKTEYYIRVTATNHAEKIYKVTYTISQESVTIEFNDSAITAHYGDDPSAKENDLWSRVISVTGLHKNDSDDMQLSEAIALLKEVIKLKINADSTSVAGKYAVTYNFINNEGSAHYVFVLKNADDLYEVSEIELGAGDVNWGDGVDKKYPDQTYGDWRDSEAHKKNHPAPEIAESALAAADKAKLATSREFIQFDYEIIDVQSSHSIGSRKNNVHAHDAGNYKVKITGFMNDSAVAGKYKLADGLTLEMELTILKRTVTVTVNEPTALKYGEKTLQEMNDYLTAHSTELYTFNADGLISEAGITPVVEWSISGSADGNGYLAVNADGYTVTLTFKDGTDGNGFKLSNYNMNTSYTTTWKVQTADYGSSPALDTEHKDNAGKYGLAIDKFRQQPKSVETGTPLVSIDSDLPSDLTVKYSYIDAAGDDWVHAFTGLPTTNGVWKVRATFESSNPNYAAPEPVEITVTIADHVHKFSETEWSHDNDNHWHTPTCGHNEEKPQDGVFPHNYDGGVVEKEPTVTEKGVRKYTCLTCGYSYTEDIPEHVHEFSETEWSHDNDNHWHTPTCGHSDAKPQESEIYPHNFGDGVVEKPATLTEKGVMKYTCTDCGYFYTEDIPQHTSKTEWAYDETHHWHVCNDCDEKGDYEEHSFSEVTTSADGNGETTYTCDKCGYSYTTSNSGQVTPPNNTPDTPDAPNSPNGGDNSGGSGGGSNAADDGKDKNLGLIIGLSVGLGALALAAAIVAIIIALKRKAKNITIVNPDDGGFYEDATDGKPDGADGADGGSEQ